MRVLYGRRGGFIACSSYPDCKNTKRFPRDGFKDLKPPEPDGGGAKKQEEELEMSHGESSESGE